MSVTYLVRILASACAVVIILTLHEFAHAAVAYACGDPTAKYEGRLTLNPLKHFDILGLIMFIFVGFGWAKPVPVNPNNFRHYKRDSILVSAAGVVLNLLLAFLFYPLYLLAASNRVANSYLYTFLLYFLYFFVFYNLNFCVFNLLPLYPLDGFRVVEALSTGWGKVYRFLRNYGYYILIGLIAESFLCNILAEFLPVFDYLNILGTYLSYVINGIAWLFGKFWGLFI